MSCGKGVIPGLGSPGSAGFPWIPEKLDEILAATEPALRAELVEADSRAATVKQRPTSRRITPAEISSLFERQGMAHSGVLSGTEKPHVSLRKGIPRTKSV
ncbi:hypothetical protein DV515_00016276, partial [Chloebia gouldiae]